MKGRPRLWIIGLTALLAPWGLAAGGEPSAPSRPASKADRPPRKVVVGTVIFGPYGKYSGLRERMAELSGFVDAMAGEAMRKYPGRGLDLAIMPETTVTSTEGPASLRAVAWEGPVQEIFGALARRHKTYLVVPLDLAEKQDSRVVYSNAAVLVDRQGTIAGIYRKAHPVAMLGRDDLENGITPGREFPVFDCDFGRLGIQICWDIVFDDGWQALADKGAEIIVWPSQSPATALPAARAGRHRYFIVSSCWRNNATFYEPTGLVAAQVETPGKVLVHELDLSYAVLGWSQRLREGKGLSEKYGERVGCHYEPREDLGMFWSNDPQTSIGAMIESLGLEEIDAQIVRNRRLQDAARGQLAN
jgi:predicted amidohydrolase